MKTILFFALLAALPFVLELALRVEFKVHTKGAILITGCSSGIGRGAAFDLVEAGYVVFAGVRKDADIQSLLEEAKTKKGLKGEIKPIIMEVTKDEDIAAALKTITQYLQQTGLPFVGLVNNAGISTRGPVETLDLKKSQKVFDVNFWGALSVTQAFIPLLRQHQGRILFISSVMGVLSLYGSTVYSGSKWALEAAVDSLRLEMSDFGVAVVSIQPGYIKTAMAESGQSSPAGTPEQLKYYQHWWDATAIRRKKSFDNGGPVEVINEVVREAFTTPYPKPRYAAGPAGPFPAYVTTNLVPFLPTRLFDLIRKKAF